MITLKPTENQFRLCKYYQRNPAQWVNCHSNQMRIVAHRTPLRNVEYFQINNIGDYSQRPFESNRDVFQR